ncbi:MAG: F0F1 ATP synthase subunit B [Acidimicrobiia bacterium]
MLAQALALAVTAAEEVKAKNPIVPETKEIVWAAIAFVLVFSLLAWKAWPAIKKGLQDREDKIRGDLEHAESVRQQAEQERKDYQAQLADARNEAGRIIEEARQSADQVRKDLIARAETDAAAIRAKAAEDAKAATERALADVQAQVGDISIELAERIVQHNLDRTTQIQLIENYINEVGGTRR